MTSLSSFRSVGLFVGVVMVKVTDLFFNRLMAVFQFANIKKPPHPALVRRFDCTHRHSPEI
jgi:hypothetical protein